MVPQSLSLTTHLPSSISFSKPINRTNVNPPKANPLLKSSFEPLKCSVSVISEPTHLSELKNKPSPSEVSRTIMELANVGTLSTLTQQSWPLGIGVRFAVDPEGTPILCLHASDSQFSYDRRSSLHVQLEQSGSRTPQCTIQGSLEKPEERMVLRKYQSLWKKRFEEEVDENSMYVVAVERVFQMEDFEQDGHWFTSLDYRNSSPDPLRNFAEKFVNEINSNNSEDVHRFCNVFVDLDFQVLEAKMIWVDRLGFDVQISSPQKGIYEVRIPFPREVADEKGAKSSFNGMSQLAWEVERNYVPLHFEKVKQLKHIKFRG